MYPCHGNHNAKDGWLIHVNAQLTKQGVDGGGGGAQGKCWADRAG